MSQHLLATKDESDHLSAAERFAARQAWLAEHGDAKRPRRITIDPMSGIVTDIEIL